MEQLGETETERLNRLAGLQKAFSFSAHNNKEGFFSAEKWSKSGCPDISLETPKTFVLG